MYVQISRERVQDTLSGACSVPTTPNYYRKEPWMAGSETGFRHRNPFTGGLPSCEYMEQIWEALPNKDAFEGESDDQVIAAVVEMIGVLTEIGNAVPAPTPMRTILMYSRWARVALRMDASDAVPVVNKAGQLEFELPGIPSQVGYQAPETD